MIDFFFSFATSGLTAPFFFSLLFHKEPVYPSSSFLERDVGETFRRDLWPGSELHTGIFFFQKSRIEVSSPLF